MKHARSSILERVFWASIIPITILTCSLVIILCGGFIYMEMQESRKVVEVETVIETETVYLSDMHTEIKTMEVTGYAPLDPKAKKGVCYSGDRNITASGNKVNPYLTIAADPSIPFGTLAMIEGFPQIFVVEDRGAAIKGNRLDICFLRQKEALEFGRQQRAVVFFFRDGE